MLTSLKYEDNVIFQKGAVQELLDNIKNYPIIDIDYIEDNEIDESNTSDTIWNVYTDGTPCIKITYGDDKTVKGNIIFASVYKKAKAKANAAILNLGKRQQEEADTAEQWRKIFIKNTEIYERRIGLLQKYTDAESLANANKTKDFIDALESLQALQDDYNGGFDYFWDIRHGYPALSESLDAHLPGGVSPSLFKKEEILIHKYEYLNVSQNDLTEEERAIKNYLILIQNDHRESLLSRLYAHTKNSDPVEKANCEILIDDLKNYPDYNEILGSNIEYKLVHLTDEYIYNINYKFYKKIGENNYELTSINANDWFSNLTNGLIYVKIGNDYKQVSNTEEDNNIPISNIFINSYIYNKKVSENTYELIDSGSNDWLTSLNNDLIYIKSVPLNQYYNINNENNDEVAKAFWIYIYNFLTQVIISAKTKRDSAEAIYNYYKAQASEFNQQKQRLEQMIAKCDQCISLIAEGQHDINQESRNIRILQGEQNVTGFGANHDITIRDIDKFIEKIAEDSNIALNSDIPPQDAIDTAGYDLISISGSASRKMVGYKYVKVGSNITFDHNLATTANNGSFVITINGTDTEVPIKGFEESDTNDLIANTNILPNINNYYNLGSSSAAWANAYINNLYPITGSTTSSVGGSDNPYAYGYFNSLYPTTGSTTSSVGELDNPYAHGYFDEIKIGDVTIGGSGGTGDASKFLRGDGQWSNTLTGTLNINNTNDGIKQGSDGANGFNSSYTGTYIGDTTASIYTTGGIYAAKNIIATRVFNAIFNDYAECRQTVMIAPGYVVIDQDNGTMVPSNKRLQPGAQIVSDTYGHLMGMTDNAKTPIAVAGRVLAYTYRPREEYHAGMAVCSAPGGTVDIMSREEIKEYPDCIIGIVSEIPNYETWGSDSVKVNGRIWIKVR